MKAVLAAVAAVLACSSAQASTVDPNRADTLFKSGLSAAEAGRHDEAIANFRYLLREVPTPRIKLELARSLYLMGEYREALYLFKEVYLDPETPQTVKRNILPYMEAAELRILRIRYGARVVTDSNPSKVAEGGTIFFNGVPLEYAPPAQKKVSYGVEPWLSVEKLWANGMLTKFYGSSRLFENEDLISGRFQFAVGKQVQQFPGLFIQTAIDTGVSKDNSYILPSVETWKRFKLSENAGFGIGGQAGYMIVENEAVSGGFYRPYVFGDWTFLPNATVFGRLSVEHLNSRNDFYTYVAPEVNFGAILSVSGFELIPQITVTRTTFSQYDAFWGLKRKDTTIRPEITVSHDRLQWNGLKPHLNVFYEERDSNVDIYDYDQMGGFVSFRKLF